MASQKSIHQPVQSKPSSLPERPRDVKDMQSQIQALAHQLWLERGAPIGSPEADWFEAEARLARGAETKTSR
jgi:hypothetical protein